MTAKQFVCELCGGATDMPVICMWCGKTICEDCQAAVDDRSSKDAQPACVPCYSWIMCDEEGEAGDGPEGHSNY